MPEHECYVEPFGGGAGLLLNKPDSEVEVYNDKDEDLVQFFHTLRTNCGELVEWLKMAQCGEFDIEAPLPYAEHIHADWVEDFYNGEVPDDPIERAARFFFLRHSQWGSKYHGNSGFGFSKKTNDAEAYINSRDRLEGFAKRFDGVVIIKRDWSDAIDMFDGPDTLFYCDPPYVGTETHYRVTGFDHQRFIRTLDRIDGKFMLSYNELPNGIKKYDWQMATKDAKFYIGNGKAGESRTLKEKLIMNFDPEEIPSFHSTSQEGFDAYADDQSDNSEDDIFGGVETTSSDSQKEDSEEITEERVQEGIDDIRDGDGEHDEEIADAIENEREEQDSEFDGMFEDMNHETEQKSKSKGKLDKLDGIASGGGNGSKEETESNEDEKDKFDGMFEEVSS